MECEFSEVSFTCSDLDRNSLQSDEEDEAEVDDVQRAELKCRLSTFIHSFYMYMKSVNFIFHVT